MAASSHSLPPLVVILGPTSSGKTALSLELAQHYNGEIVSADSRQVYKGLDIGTSKVTAAEQAQIPHHLLDVSSPSQQVSVAEYKKLADTAIEDITAKGKVPFLVGGSALYLYAVIDNYAIPEIAADPEYRAELETMFNSERLAILENLDPETFARIDQKNPRRVIRALEVIRATGESFTALQKKGGQRYNPLLIGIERPREELYMRIDTSVDSRIQAGLVEEVRGLLDQGVPQERLMSFGLEYRFLARYLAGELSLEEAVQQLKYATHDFARRQMTWFRKDDRIHWISDKNEAEALIEAFLS